MKTNPLLAAITTQKGGIGKSTLTTLLASVLHYERGLNVAVIDCDFPQHSINDMRKRETDIALKNDYYKRLAYDQLKSLGKKAYLVKTCLPEEAIDEAQKLVDTSTGKIDIIFFDLPGTINNPGVIHTVAQLDYIFAPITADHLTVKSTLMFTNALREISTTNPDCMVKGIHLFWTQVDAREKTELYGMYEDIIHGLGFDLFKSSLPDSKRFRKEISNDESKPFFRSTMFAPDKKQLRGSGLEEWLNEVIHILGV